MANAQSPDIPDFLKLSNVKTHKLTSKTNKPLNYNSKFNYGLSYEAPTYFASKHSLIDDNSYENPHILLKNIRNMTEENKGVKKNFESLKTLQEYNVHNYKENSEGKMLVKQKVPSKITFELFIFLKIQI